MDGDLSGSARGEPLAVLQDASCACRFVLGREAATGADLDGALDETPRELFDRLYRSEEFKAAVVSPAILTGALPSARFGSTPAVGVLDWVARWAPMEASTRVLVLRAQGWGDAHRALAADAVFAEHMREPELGWSLEAFRHALRQRPNVAGVEAAGGWGRLKIDPAPATADEGMRVDEAAFHRLSDLPAEHLAVLFDVKHIERAGGEAFASADEAVTAYFARPPHARFPCTPLFDADHYTGDPAWPGSPGVDPFAHFIAHADRHGPDPHRLIGLRTLMAGPGDGRVLERLCDLMLGEVDGPIHPLLHLPFIRAQPGGRDLSCADILALAGDAATPLPFSPHPLFCVREYRRRNAPGACNELQHYLRAGKGAQRTHPLISPSYIQAARPEARASARRSLLEAYLETWPDMPVDPSIFVDIKHLNHQFAWRGEVSGADPLSRAVSARVSDAAMLHPDLDGRLLDFAFGDLSASPAAAELLRAAFDLAPQPRSRAGRPLVSVVMVTYRKPVFTALSVLAALRALASIPHEIIVVENGGELIHHEELLRLFAPHATVRMIKLEENRYFGEGSNIGADMASGEYVLFLNNDCLLAPDFGEQLRGLLCEGEQRFDALGAALVFPNGDIQEFGGSVSDDGQVLQRAKHLPPSFLASLPDLERTDYASATCLCVARRALDKVGGFDPLFEPFYFEDTDLCRRLAKAGMSVHVSSRLRAMHVENGTTREFLGSGFNTQIARNREAFARRWLKRGGEDAYLDTQPQVRVTAPERPRALVYTPFDITPGGGERYLLSAARKLAETHEVVIATSRRMSRARVEFARHALGVQPFAFRIGPAEEVIGQGGPFDIAFVMANEIAPPIAPAARLNLFHLQFPFPWRTVGRVQFDLLEGYDAILVNSPYTAHWTRERLREAGVATPPPIEVLAPPVQAMPRVARSPRRSGDPVRLVNVGRFFRGGHCKRQDVVLQVVAGLRAQGVAAEATLLGSVPRASTAEAYYADIAAQARRLGGVDVMRDAGRGEIAKALAASDVYLHACGFGVDVSLEPEAAEHYGIAVVEAVQAGCYPVVVDAGGPVQIVRDAGRGDVYATVPEAVRAIRAALEAGRLDGAPAPAMEGVSDAAFDSWFDRRLQAGAAVASLVA